MTNSKDYIRRQDALEAFAADDRGSDATDNVLCHQVVYGKPVLSEFGTAAPERDASTSNMTPFSKEEVASGVALFCRPSKLGIRDMSGTWEAYRWSQLAWPAPLAARTDEHFYFVGGVVVVPKQIEGQWFVVACRQRQRREGCEEGPEQLLKRLHLTKSGRPYKQAHYLLMEAESTRYLTTLKLPKHLKAKPTKTGDPPLELLPVAVDRTLPLPDNWLALADEVLEKLLQGQRYYLHGGDPERAYQQIMCALSCLPFAIRWRVPIGVGMFEIDAGIAVGHGMYLTSEAEAAEKRPATLADLQAFESYRRWLRAVASGATTFYQLIDCVDQGLAEWKYDQWDFLLNDASTWQQHIHALGDKTGLAIQRHELRIWLEKENATKPCPQLPSATINDAKRPDILAAIARCCHRREWSRLQFNEVLAWAADREQQSAWQKAVQAQSPDEYEVGDLAMLLGQVDVETNDLAGVLARVCDWPVPVPDGRTSGLRARLASVIDDAWMHATTPVTPDYGDLARIVMLHGHAEWLRHWQDDLAREIEADVVSPSDKLFVLAAPNIAAGVPPVRPLASRSLDDRFQKIKMLDRVFRGEANFDEARKIFKYAQRLQRLAGQFKIAPLALTSWLPDLPNARQAPGVFALGMWRALSSLNQDTIKAVVHNLNDDAFCSQFIALAKWTAAQPVELPDAMIVAISKACALVDCAENQRRAAAEYFSSWCSYVNLAVIAERESNSDGVIRASFCINLAMQDHPRQSDDRKKRIVEAISQGIPLGQGLKTAAPPAATPLTPPLPAPPTNPKPTSLPSKDAGRRQSSGTTRRRAPQPTAPTSRAASQPIPIPPSITAREHSASIDPAYLQVPVPQDQDLIISTTAGPAANGLLPWLKQLFAWRPRSRH